MKTDYLFHETYNLILLAQQPLNLAGIKYMANLLTRFQLDYLNEQVL